MLVVIPASNSENLIPCVNSLFDTNPNLNPSDLIIVDDGLKDVPNRGTTIKGEKPFIFSRNVNIGLKKALETDQSILVVSDDVIFQTPDCLNLLANVSGYGIVSPGIIGECGNHNQRNRSRKEIAPEKSVLCFICILINIEVLHSIGLMDERFVGYGYDDVDYCRRAIDKGFQLGVLDSVSVLHNGKSTYRTNPNFTEISKQNKKIYEEKWV